MRAGGVKEIKSVEKRERVRGEKRRTTLSSRDVVDNSTEELDSFDSSNMEIVWRDDCGREVTRGPRNFEKREGKECIHCKRKKKACFSGFLNLQ